MVPGKPRNLFFDSPARLSDSINRLGFLFTDPANSAIEYWGVQ